LSFPADAPLWFQNGFREVSREDLGPQYKTLLQDFIALERSTGFVQAAKGEGKPKGLKGSSLRPQQVMDWIRDGRGRSQVLRAIADITEFKNDWWAWWRGMQPDWRTAGDNAAVPNGADWGVLAVPGQNGLLSVVACLYWWGCA
ncbi:hypothetical protein B0H14DRAFT_2276923, partial [Mycena olivaceomarginata]